MKIDTEAKAARAGDLFNAGYNCAQSVFVAFAKEMGVSEAKALQIASGMGGGVGGLGQICGAFTGAVMALGALRGHHDPKAQEQKKWVNAAVRNMHQGLVDRYGTSDCALLKPAAEKDALARLPEGQTEPGTRPCVRYVQDCVRLLAGELEKE